MPIILELLTRLILGIFYFLLEIFFEGVVSESIGYLYRKIRTTLKKVSYKI